MQNYETRTYYKCVIEAGEFGHVSHPEKGCIGEICSLSRVNIKEPRLSKTTCWHARSTAWEWTIRTRLLLVSIWKPTDEKR
jgi:hypothetical protein